MNDMVTKALKDEPFPEFVDGVALGYIETGMRGPLDDASKPFLEIMRKLSEHETGVLNELGAGAHLGDLEQVRRHVRHIIELLENLVLVAIEREGVKGFFEAYQSRDFMHHVLYFED